MFQFQIGAIKSLSAWHPLPVDKFQFQIGAIKSYPDVNLQYVVTFEFQFQIGAIKRTVSPLWVSPITSFQFQIGAIKS